MGEEGLHIWRSMMMGVVLPSVREPRDSCRCLNSSSSCFIHFSYSRSCPRKLKFGEMVGLLSFTYLQRQCTMKITPTQKQMIYRFHNYAERKDNVQDINHTYTERQRFNISKTYTSFFFFFSFNDLHRKSFSLS